MTPQEQPSICVGCRWATWHKETQCADWDTVVLYHSGECGWEPQEFPKLSASYLFVKDIIADDARVGASSCPVREPEEPKS